MWFGVITGEFKISLSRFVYGANEEMATNLG